MDAQASLFRTITPELSQSTALNPFTDLYDQVIGRPVTFKEMRALYKLRFSAFIELGIAFRRLDRRFRNFDHSRLAAALASDRELVFGYPGAKALYDRCLLQSDGVTFELPQWFWMRLAMGQALTEAASDRTERAIDLYHLFSTLR
jgi:ribonucleoside-diphosphate reductase alpha chain